MGRAKDEAGATHPQIIYVVRDSDGDVDGWGETLDQVFYGDDQGCEIACYELKHVKTYNRTYHIKEKK